MQLEYILNSFSHFRSILGFWTKVIEQRPHLSIWWRRRRETMVRIPLWIKSLLEGVLHSTHLNLNTCDWVHIERPSCDIKEFWVRLFRSAINHKKKYKLQILYRSSESCLMNHAKWFWRQAVASSSSGTPCLWEGNRRILIILLQQSWL